MLPFWLLWVALGLAVWVVISAWVLALCKTASRKPLPSPYHPPVGYRTPGQSVSEESSPVTAGPPRISTGCSTVGESRAGKDRQAKLQGLNRTTVLTFSGSGPSSASGMGGRPGTPGTDAK